MDYPSTTLFCKTFLWIYVAWTHLYHLLYSLICSIACKFIWYFATIFFVPLCLVFYLFFYVTVCRLLCIYKIHAKDYVELCQLNKAGKLILDIMEKTDLINIHLTLFSLCFSVLRLLWYRAKSDVIQTVSVDFVPTKIKLFTDCWWLSKSIEELHVMSFFTLNFP